MEHSEQIMALRKDVDMLKDLMGGDFSKGTPGVAQNVIRMMSDMYQPPEGISPRLKQIEEWRLRRETQAATAVVMVRLLWAVFFAAMGFLLKMMLK